MNALIETVNQLGGQFLQFAWPMLWQSSLLIGFVLALDFLLARKIRAAVRYALWLAVLVKLLLPPALALPTGAAWWLFPAKPPMKAPAIKNYVVTYDNVAPQLDLPAQSFVPPEPPAPKLDGAGWTLLASESVSAGLLLWLAFRWWQVRQMVRQAIVSENIFEPLHEARRSAGWRSSARLKITDARMSPAVCGLFRPVILLPRALAERLSAGQLRAVLLHELFHLRRKDVWLNCAQALLQIVYWWHPLLWVANARIRRVREEAVDDAVMLALRDEADSYALTLLEVAKLAFRRPLLSLGLVGIMESRSALRQRIERLVDFRAPRRAGLTFASLCGIFAFSAVALPMGEGPAPTEKTPLAAPASAATNSPSGSVPQTNCPAVVVSAQIYQMRTDDFKNLVANLQFNHSGANEDSWWSASPWLYRTLKNTVAIYGLSPLISPRVLTSSSTPAQMYVGNGTNSIELDCTPVVNGERIAMAVHGQVVDGAGNKLLTNQFRASASAENLGGVVIRLDGLTASNLVAVIGVELVTNSPAKHFEQRLVPLGNTNAMSAPSQEKQLVQDGKLLFEMGKLDAAQMKLEAALAADPQNATANYYLGLIQTNRQGPKLVQTSAGRQQIIRQLETIRLENFSTSDRGLPLTEVLRQLVGQSRLRDPERKGINFLINNNPDRSGQPVAGPTAETAATTNEPVDVGSCLIKIPSLTNMCFADLLDAVVLAADHPIKYSVQDFAVVFSAKVPGPVQLFNRTFKLDTNVLYTAMQAMGTPPAGSASEVMGSFIKNLGINMESPKGQTLFYNATRGVFFVKATAVDLDLIEKALRVLPEIPPGTPPQPALPQNPTNGTGILSGTNFQAALRALQQRGGAGSLAEPEVTTISGRGVNRIDSPPVYYAATHTNIVAKLDRIRLEKFSTGEAGKPLREVLAQLNGESKWRDPERKGIDFAINSGGTNTAASEDVGAMTIKIPNLTDVRLADVLDAIVLVAEHPIKYSIRDSDVIFSAKSSEEPPQLFMRTFRVDPHAFYLGLENVSNRSIDIGVGPDGLPYATTKTNTTTPSTLARMFFANLGVNLQEPPGKAVFFNDRLGYLFVKATEDDLDTIERSIQVLNQVPPQIHIKARFYKVPRETLLGLQKFGVLSNSAAQFTGILTTTNATAVRHALQAQSGIEVLAEPEVTTLSGRQTQMRATTMITVVTNTAFEEIYTNQNGLVVSNAIVPQTTTVETGPILDVVPYVLADGYTINLALIPSLTEFLGYDKSTNTTAAYNRAGEKIDLPRVLPRFAVRQMTTTLNLWDDQTAVLGGLPVENYVNGVVVKRKTKANGKEVVIFVTATIVDPAGNRVHSDGELQF